MSLDPIRNFAKVAVSTTYNSSATSIVLNTGHGAKLPDPSTEGAFNLIWFNSTSYPDPSDDPLVEIARVTSRSGDTLTVTRGSEGTTASNKNTASVTYLMILSLTQKTMNDLQRFSTSTDQTDFANQSFSNILKNGNFESWSLGITSAPDGWSLESGTTILRDSANKKMGTYGATITSLPSTQGSMSQLISDVTYFQGRAVTLGGWVKTSTAARVCIYVQDFNGTTYLSNQSPYHTGSGNWEYLVVPFGVRSSITQLTVSCMILTGSSTTAYFDGMILVEGSVVPSFSPRPIYDDAKTLTIDSPNNRVGINNTTPSEALDISGNIAITGTVDGIDISAHAAATGTSVHGLGTMSVQPASSVTITGGSITGITDLAVTDGGTGRGDAVVYAPICGGTTSTGAHQSVASVGTAGHVLTSNGAGTLPSFQAASVGSQTAAIWLSAEGAYLPVTNPAVYNEAPPSTTYVGWSYLAFDDTTAQTAVWRVPMPKYDGGNITVKTFSKPQTTPSGSVTLQYDILTIGLANGEDFNTAVITDTTVNISHSLTTSTLSTQVHIANATIDPANVAADDLLVIGIRRDVASDNLVGNGQLLGILIEYTKT